MTTIAEAVAAGIIKDGATVVVSGGPKNAGQPSEQLFGYFNGGAWCGGVYVRQEGVHFTDDFKSGLQQKSQDYIAADVEAKRIK